MKTLIKFAGIIIFIGALMHAPGAGAQIQIAPSSETAMVNTMLIVSGLPPGTDVQFILNAGVPVFVKVDASGTATFLPLLEGSLEIIAMQDGAIIYNAVVTVIPAVVVSQARANNMLLVSGLPPGADVQFILNGGTSIFAKADNNGTARYLPLLEGSLEIIAMQDGAIIYNAVVTVIPAVAVSDARVNTTLLVSGLPPGADVQFIMNGGTSIFAKADNDGTARYLPLLEGSLEIIAMQDGVIIYTATITVSPAAVVSVSEARVNTTLLVSNLPPGADVQFIMNGGTSIFVKADSAGTARYLPLLEGSLEIIVMQDGVVIDRIAVTVLREITHERIPPAGITALHNTTFLQDSINWTWNDPADADFDHVEVYIDGNSRGNAGKGIEYYNATGFAPASQHSIATRTVDMNGNVNQTWVNHTAMTKFDIVISMARVNTTIIVSGLLPGTDVQFNLTGGTSIIVKTDDNGTAMFLSQLEGSLDIVAMQDGVIIDSDTVTVLPELKSIAVSPSTATVIVGNNQTFTAADQVGNSIDPAWISSNTTVGTISGAGMFTAKASGITTITAAIGNISGNAIVTVKAKETKHREGSSDDSTGGGGVTTSEPAANIEKSEGTDNRLIANTPVKYDFTQPEHGVEQIVVTGSGNEAFISLRVEALKGTAKIVSAQPPGKVYKNLNIWAGTKLIKKAVIVFRIENSWMQSNNLAGNDVKMLRWNASKWVPLETRELNKDDTYTRFEAVTEGFSTFAITALKTEPAPEPTAITKTQIEPTVTQIPAVPKQKTAGFELVLAITALCALYVMWKRRR